MLARGVMAPTLIGIVITCARASSGISAEPIKIGLIKNAAGGPFYIAQEKGYFAAEGVPAELIYFDAGAPVAVATASGSLDFGAAGVSAALYTLAAQGALRIVGGGAREVPGFEGSGFLVSNRAYAAGLRSFKDLSGHSVGITVFGGVFHYTVVLLSEKYGFAMSSIRLLPLQSIPNIASALAGGTADAGLQNSTGIIPLVQRGEAKLLARIGDEVPWQVSAQWTTSKTADTRRETVDRFLRAYHRGVREYHDAFTGENETRQDGPTAPEVLAIIAKYVGQTPEQLRTAIPYIDAEGRFDVKDILHQIAWFKSQGMLKGEIGGDAIIDKRYVIPLPER